MKCTYNGCNKETNPYKLYCKQHYNLIHRRKWRAENPIKIKTLEEQFWEKVDKKSDDECWVWIAGCYKNGGYGAFHYQHKPCKAHRYSWILHYGEIPDGMLVCHKCDNPPCVNPSHLFLGSSLDNNRDRVKKGRSNNVVGEKHGHHRYTEDEIKNIKRLLASKQYTQREIAKITNISYKQVNFVATGRTWGWLDV